MIGEEDETIFLSRHFHFAHLHCCVRNVMCVIKWMQFFASIAYSHRFHNFNSIVVGVERASARARTICLMSFVFWYYSNQNFTSCFESGRRFFQQKSHKQWDDCECASHTQTHTHTYIFQGCSFSQIRDFPPSFNHLFACLLVHLHLFFVLFYCWIVQSNGNSMVKNGFIYIPKCVNDGL